MLGIGSPAVRRCHNRKRRHHRLGKSPVPRKGPRSTPPGPVGAYISENARQKVGLEPPDAPRSSVTSCSSAGKANPGERLYRAPPSEWPKRLALSAVPSPTSLFRVAKDWLSLRAAAPIHGGSGHTDWSFVIP